MSFKDNILDGYFRCLILGQSGSGKTYWMIHELIPLLGDKYDTVVIFTKEYNIGIYKKFLPKSIIVTSDFKLILRKIKEKQSKNVKGSDPEGQPIFKSNILIIFDDILDEHLFKDREFMDLFTQMRHMQTSTIVISQLTSGVINTSMKANTSHYCIFRISDYYQRLVVLRIIEGAIANTLSEEGIDATHEEVKIKAKNLYNDHITRKKYGHVVVTEFGDLFL